MNKTVNINLANILFHIDENAYNKMRRYLESVKRSFANTSGSDEILADIEARIAELFHEKLANERQVITTKEVDEVIAIMGQPEDYMVDEDIFDDEPVTASKEPKRVKKLYRDIDAKYVAGVSAGLGHYIGVDPIWVRILWIVLTVGSGGSFALIYGLLWILIPEAKTTAQKLDMRGEDVNISNIERKVKEGFDEVADRVKNVDYEKVGNKVKSSGKTFFDTLGEIIMFFFKIIGKFVGIILIITGGAGLIAMLIGLFTVGVFDTVHLGPLNLYELVDATNTPFWIVAIVAFLLVAIPLFFLLYLGLKILITNLKSIGSVAKFSLLGLWLISFIAIIILGAKQASSRAFWDSAITDTEYYINSPNDTLNIAFTSNDLHWNRRTLNIGDMIVSYDDNGQEILSSQDVEFNFKTSKDSLIHIEVQKNSNGKSFLNARETAEKIDYEFRLEGNTLELDEFLTTRRENKFKNQEVRVFIYLPKGMKLKFLNTVDNCWRINTKNDSKINDCDVYDFKWMMGNNGTLQCLDCPVKELEFSEDENRVKINGNGIDININENGEKGKIKINEDGIDIDVHDNGESFILKIDENGIRVDADEN
ncbi:MULTISPECIES: PspC domain-containing protein [unclassified Cellulophaga]|uniref:PspC domain-containing protein n=1 Tax=unclassified Cellulophaga TaxID=2634405 RepID=UPI001C4FE40B|nr:PspC domain-containing protein [Cellulophaga sp. HaHa_2_1]QXP52158.1 PspC domain-containing protein [Cellulophaga sp. HaHa_2_1]